MQEGYDYHADNASFMVYKDWEQYIEMLDSDEEAGKLFKALFAFAKRGEEAEFYGALKFAFVMMKNFIDRDGKKWEETCIANRNNGKKGGAPKGNQNARKNNPKTQAVVKTTQNNPEQAKQPDKDIDIDKDTGTDKDTDMISSSTSKKSPKPPRHCYGEYQHVRLTEAQYQKLAEAFGEAVIREYIQKIDEWQEARGLKSYKNYALVIRQWMRRDGITERSGEHDKYAGTAAAEGFI